MKITDEHRKKLCELLYYAFLEMRMLGWAGKSHQAADLADAFHNLPKDMWRDGFALEVLRDGFLKAYQEKYPDAKTFNYVAAINDMLAAGEDYRMN